MNNTSDGFANSRRRFDKVTYTPVKTQRSGESRTGDALARAALVRALEAKPQELDRLAEKVKGAGERAALEAIRVVGAAASGSQALAAAAQVGAVDDTDLITVTRKLASLRGATGERLKQELNALDARHQEAQRTATAQAEVQAAAEPAAAAPPSAASPVAGKVPAVAPASVRPLLTQALGASLAQRAGDVIGWAAAAEPARVEALQAEAGLYVPPQQRSAGLVDALPEIDRLSSMADRVGDALAGRSLEPVGLLHLERLVMTPMDAERGELVYSLPLAPREKVTLAHKEWTTREEEFQRYIQDYMENFSEQGVAEADDIAMAAQTQIRHANALSMSSTSGSTSSATSGVTITSAVDATASDTTSTVEDLASREESRIHARTVTAKASARTIKDQKISFTVTTVSGVEDFTARVIENPHDDKAMVIDYFRRMRGWRNDFYRHGVRMTYDIVVPDPGRKLRERLDELRAIEERLSAPFSLDPSTIDPGNWQPLQKKYGIPLPPPPPDQVQIEASVFRRYPAPGEDGFHDGHDEVLKISVPTGYHLAALTVFYACYADRPEAVVFVRVGLFEKLVVAPGHGSGGGIIMSEQLYFTKAPAGGESAGLLPMDSGVIEVLFRVGGCYQINHFKVIGNMAPTEATLFEWRRQCWSLCKQADLELRERDRDRRAKLLNEISALDALDLRRMEREQIMRAVLQWLFPSITGPGDIGSRLDNPGSLNQVAWQQVMEYGEYIKFVHAAIDWDNVMVLLFPYFWATWDDPSYATFRRRLDHPDPLHREFLRAGAARVVLTIQPDFEEQVVALLDQGYLGPLSDQGHRFTRVVADVQAANANYARSTEPSPDHEGDDPREPGALIGSWFDHTPTGALDIDVTTRPVYHHAGRGTVTFVVTVPEQTDHTDRAVFLAGDLNKLDPDLPFWDPGGVRLTRVDATHWRVTLSGRQGTTIQYKYALGDWGSVEKTATCAELVHNRTLTLSFDTSDTVTVYDTVRNWRNVSPCN